MLGPAWLGFVNPTLSKLGVLSVVACYRLCPNLDAWEQKCLHFRICLLCNILIDAAS